MVGRQLNQSDGRIRRWEPSNGSWMPEERERFAAHFIHLMICGSWRLPSGNSPLGYPNMNCATSLWSVGTWHSWRNSGLCAREAANPIQQLPMPRDRAYRNMFSTAVPASSTGVRADGWAKTNTTTGAW